jgi:acylphosphatase
MMQTQLKRYSVTIRGKVQHIGYRGIIEGTGRKLDLKGYVFNDLDNSVKIVCEGLQKYYEFSRKFDIGLDYLDGIKTDTGEIKVTLGDMKGSLNSIDNTLGIFVVEQREHNKRMDEHNQWMKEHSLWMKGHNQRLEKILEKLAGR